MSSMEIRVNFLSDTVLYLEAQEFVQQHHPMPDTKQLMGLSAFSRNWSDLLSYINHQAARDWGAREHYKLFYEDLKRYLNDARTGLRQRVKLEFKLVDQGLSKNEERQSLDEWAQRLAQEFIQHLVAEARLQLGR